MKAYLVKLDFFKDRQNYCYRSGWKVFEKFKILKFDFSPNLRTSKLLVTLFG